MVEGAQRECGLSAKEAWGLTVASLKHLILNQRDALADKHDPMKNRPKGFSTMRKKDLIQCCKDRAIPLDTVSETAPSWEKVTVNQLKIAIEEHVAFSKGLGPYQKQKTKQVVTTTFQKTNMSDDSSEEFQEVCMEVIRQEQKSASSSRRKRNA